MAASGKAHAMIANCDPSVVPIKANLMKLLLAAVAWFLLAVPSHAHEIKFGTLEIVHPTVDEALKGQAAAKGSMEIRNHGKAADRLLSITAECAEKARIETSDTIVPPGGRLLVPIVFENIKRKLSNLEVYDGELVFEKAGRVKIEFMVHAHGHSLHVPNLASVR
jgi:copper(I)-binding protein